MCNQSLVTNQSETYCKEEESSITASSHIFCILCWSGTYFSCYGLASAASSPISSVLKWSGTYLSMYGLLRTASLHISCVLKWSETSRDIYINTFGPRQESNFWTERRSTFESILQSDNSFDVKNDYWRLMIIAINRCMSNEYTPKKWWFFFEKTMKAYFKAVIWST